MKLFIITTWYNINKFTCSSNINNVILQRLPETFLDTLSFYVRNSIESFWFEIKIMVMGFKFNSFSALTNGECSVKWSENGNEMSMHIRWNEIWLKKTFMLVLCIFNDVHFQHWESAYEKEQGGIPSLEAWKFEHFFFQTKITESDLVFLIVF